MSYIFKKSTNLLNGEKKYGSADILIPNNGYEEMDVVRKFPWTNTPKNNPAREEAPFIKLREFYLLESYMTQLLKSYGMNGSNVKNLADAFVNFANIDINSSNLYQGLYDHANPTGFEYTLPYFSTDNTTTSNTWAASPKFQEITNLQKKIAGYGAATGTVATGLAAGGIVTAATLGAGSPVGIQIASASIKAATAAKAIAERTYELNKLREQIKIGMGSPVANMTDPAIDKPHLWGSTAPRSFNVTFPLYNILDTPSSGSTLWNEQIIKNWELCYLLCYQNLYNKRNLFTGTPPTFYQIDIPGIHFSKAGYINNLSISNLGNVRKIQLPVGQGGDEIDVNVPDAYVINLTITDFFMPSKNFMAAVCDESKRGALVTGDGSFSDLKEPANRSPKRNRNNNPNYIFHPRSLAMLQNVIVIDIPNW